jgi:hypothetical protein
MKKGEALGYHILLLLRDGYPSLVPLTQYIMSDIYAILNYLASSSGV